ncbi:protein rexA [Proteus mirabilis]|uniref:protein rexA n=1 Tax=Proteus TaxID=583 RepID=UPI001179F350|nr:MULTISPECIES: protein rexA [Proteus]MBG2799831.1 protein rexA [Proteus mirabilis]TRY10051.1 protein rexA [Proteus mirabilis]HCT1710696.1 protein rexA [Proteus mirabilis]HCT3579690.1 protein rexA [Proteus mirabilis]HEK2879720.1 protein rexA [Proteus mirabilis]
MKVSFWAYYAQNTKTQGKRSIDLSGIINEKIIDTSSHAMNCGDYFTYMHPIDIKTFLFTKTSDSDLIKKINQTNNSIKDIRDSLASDELLGFPSFLFIDQGILGYASSFMGPKIRELSDFAKSKNLIEEDENLILEPLMKGTSKNDALKMNFIGRTTLRVESGNPLTRALLRLVGVQNATDELLSGIEIIIKPQKAKDIKHLTKEIINNNYDQIDDISIKAKNSAADILTEYYLDGKGHLGINLPKKVSNAEIANEIYTAFIRLKPAIMESYKYIKEDLE